MFRKILNSRIGRIACWYVIFALTLPLYTFSTATRANAQDAGDGGQAVAGTMIKTAVIGLDNQTDREILDDDYGIGQIISTAMKLGLEEKEKLDFVPKNEVLNYIEKGDKITDSLAISAGKAVEAEQLIFGSISNADVPSSDQASVVVELSIYDVQKGVLVSKSRVMGYVYQHGFTGSADELLKLAVQDGLKKSLDECFTNLYKYGVVTLVSGDTITTNLAERDGITKGALIAVLHDSGQIATVEVKETSVAFSRASVTEVNERSAIKPGDKVRLVYTPSTSKIEKTHSKKSKKFNPVVLALVAGAILLSASGESKGAEPPTPSRSGFVTVADGPFAKAVVMAPNGWYRNYMPAPPVDKSNDAAYIAAYVESCNNSDQFGINIKETGTQLTYYKSTLFDFRLTTSPQSTTIPGGGYVIGLKLTVDPSVASKLKIATCNPDTQKWEIISGTYGKVPWLNNEYGVTAIVTHFTPYVVVKDDSSAFLPAPGNVRATGDEGQVTVSWDKVVDSTTVPYTVLGYNVYQCNKEQCYAYKEQSLPNTTTSRSYSASDGTEVCYAVEAFSDLSTANPQRQFAQKSSIVCATPGQTQIGITLQDPPNGALIQGTPSFTFLGTGAADYYILTVKDETNNIVFTYHQTGEGTPVPNASGTVTVTRAAYAISYGGTALGKGKTYTWSVTGYTVAGDTTLSNIYNFTYTGGTSGTPTGECLSLTDSPILVAPTNGSLVTNDTGPLFVWRKVDNATKYLLKVVDDQSQTVMESLETSTSKQYTSGTKLVDNKTYNWHVSAFNDCATATVSADWFFTKKPMVPPAALPTPQWVSPSPPESKQPIIGGDQYVILNWRQVISTLLYGYKIYRNDSPDLSSANLIATIIKDQLNVAPSNTACPTFSETNPGYCDVSVTNGKRYYYFVAAMDNGFTAGNYSVAQSVLLNLQRPVLIAPGSLTGETVTADSPTFIWQAVNGESIKYLLVVKEQLTGITVWQSDPITGTSVGYGGNGVPLKDQSIYIWNVTALNDLARSEVSQTFKFTKGPSEQPPDVPYFCKGVSGPPTANCTGNSGGPPYEYNSSLPFDTIRVYWKRVAGTNIKGYNVYRSTDSATVRNSGSLITQVKDADCERAGQACFEQSGLARGVIYYYAVTAVDTANTESGFSDILQIRYDLRSPVLIYPTVDSVVYDANPAFQWLAVQGTTKYRIQLDKDGGFSSSGLKWNALFDAPAGNSVVSIKYGDIASPVEPLRNPSSSSSVGEPYFWRVCAINPITTSDAACTPANRFYKNLKPPEQKSPSNEFITSDNVVFNWLTSPGAANYTLRICEGYWCCDTTSCSAPIIFVKQGISGTDTSFTLSSSDVKLETCDTPGNLSTCSTGIYSWQIRAIDGSGAVSGEWKDHLSKTFYKIPLPAPDLLTPANMTIIMPDSQEANAALCQDLYQNWTYKYNPHFEWEPTSQANNYTFKIIDVAASQDAGHEVIYEQLTVGATFVDLNECSLGNTSGAIPLAAGRIYKWNVAAGSNGVFLDSNARIFYTGMPYPRPMAPEDGKQVILSDNCDGQDSKLCVHFEWDGGVFDNGNVVLQGVIGAGSYDIEILDQQRNVYYCERKTSKAARCDTSNRNCSKNTFVTSCDLSTADALNNDRFTWRVRARDSSDITADDGGTGNPGPWSQSRNFTVLIPAPRIAVPPNSPDPTGCYVSHAIGGDSGVAAMCTSMTCVNPRFYWSPIPLSQGSCYRIEISDTSDFRNLLFVRDSIPGDPDADKFECAPGVGCNSFKTPIAPYIPMTNGVKYYWRVGASVPPETSAPCGATWIYSDTFTFLKRPNSGLGLSYANVTYQGVTLNWTAPDNCQNDATDAVSVPTVPPNGGEYIVYMDQGSSLPTPNSPPEAIYAHLPPTQRSLDIASGLSAATDYIFCVVAVDDSFYYADGGHVSPFECVKVHTATAPTTP